MSLHKEIRFEDDVVDHLGAHGWIYEAGAGARHDRSRALFVEDLVAWVQDSQSEAWEALSKTHGPAAAEVLADRVRKSLDDRGVLDVLRGGLDMVGLRRRLDLAQFKPAMGMNPEITRRYQANRLRVARQVRYSTANENCFDLVLYLNGVPVATVELKTDFTQSLQDAIDQYRFDRDPRPKGGKVEPLLNFPGGALVHFAVSNGEVAMTTKLQGRDTFFLPFNKGDHGGKGNPVNPNGHRTAYLWEQVWQRDSWLEILGRYMVTRRDAKKQITGVIFPRYHQLDATRKLAAQVLEEGPGGRFLIQHSAGSGKTNSIAWAAHLLSELHDANDDKLFSSVIVVSDRNVIDTQLQEALFDFQRIAGVVATIKSDSGSKSGQLAEALAAGKKVIVCTIQTFPFALKEVRERAATEGQAFAVIADEAHSSQTGEAAAKLKQMLSAEEAAELADGGEVSNEDILAAQMAGRAASDKGITYVAFTATPKGKTMELFGRPPHPDRPVGDGNLPGPFHVYSMRQAIEEGFILDVLRNYTPYQLAFKLAHEGRDLDDKEVERSKAKKEIMRWVRLHPHNISQKVQIVVEHYRENVLPLLDGKAKAMVVLGSRAEAVRWQVAMQRYIKEQGYPLGTLVAFSGEVPDKDLGEVSETSPVLNPGLNGRDIRDAFKDQTFHLLLVANKFQTGFDQPLLCGMYVDRRLAGIQAVQTLSRLNRAHPSKDTTYVLDFVNSSEEILAAFRTYYETAELESATDPNLIYDLRAKLDGAGHYDDFEVERVVKVELHPVGRQSDLIAAIEPVASRIVHAFNAAKQAWTLAEAQGDERAKSDAQDHMDALTLFKGDMGTFVRLYSFLSQILDYGNTEIEKRAIFYRRLLPLLEFGREREGIDLSGVKLTHHSLKAEAKRDLLYSGGDAPKLPGMSDTGSGSLQEKDKARLDEIIARVNDLFEGQLTDDDQLHYVNGFLKSHMLASEELQEQAKANTRAQFSASPTLKQELLDAVMDSDEAFTTMSRQVLSSERVREELLRILLGPVDLYGELRRMAGANEVEA
ncbi:type I restriction endonuclease subunit R [Caulobacter hibisci]|uniref:Type I restriction endonuclease subunit R n=1 Tax=Caulobacter hibisci TaxID=2035993 RepID=A0ABS0T4N0_9CAUL|nr:type I restriction endonuclease subunit R [Caulobacter hibisci]